MSEAYRLESLLALRRREEDQSKESLARAQAALFAAQAGLAAAHEETERRQAALRKAQDQLVLPISRRAGEREALERFVVRRRDEMAAAEALRVQEAGHVARAEGAVAAARLQLTVCAREREAVEKHRERWEVAQRADASRREEKMLDEFANRRGPGSPGGVP